MITKQSAGSTTHAKHERACTAPLVDAYTTPGLLALSSTLVYTFVAVVLMPYDLMQHNH